MSEFLAVLKDWAALGWAVVRPLQWAGGPRRWRWQTPTCRYCGQKHPTGRYVNGHRSTR